MKIRGYFLILGIFLFPIELSRAHAQGVETAIVGTMAAKEVFSDLRENLESIISQAEATGNRLIQKLAETALDLLEATEASAGRVIDKSFDRLDDTTRNAANSVKEVLDRIESSETILMDDATRLSANMVSALRSLPLVADLNEVYSFSPRVAAPTGTDIIRIKVLGPGMGSANAVASLEGNNLEIQKITTSEIQIAVPRNKLEFGPGNSNFAKIDLSFDEKEAGFLSNTFGWFNPKKIQRNLYLWQLPTKVAEWSLQQNVVKSVPERTLVRTTVTANGRDAPGGNWANVRSDHYEAKWRLDTAALGKAVDKCTSDRTMCKYHGFVEGRAMTCVGPDMKNADKRRVYYKMQFGHYNQNGHKRGGYGICFINLPLVRTNEIPETIQQTGELGWADSILSLNPNAKSWTLTLKLFDNRIVKIGPTFSVPRMNLQVEKARDGILLRPITPKDF